MTKLIFYSVLFLFFINNSTFAQSQEELEIKAYAALNDADYESAYIQFDALNAKYPKKEDYKIKLGICCLRYPERKERAIEIFQGLKNSKIIDADYYLGKAYHINYKFTEAKPLLTAFIERLGKKPSKEDTELIDDAQLILKNCDNGLTLIDKKVIANIKNIGAPINTDEDQYVPSIATDESMMLFTYRGKNSMGGKLNNSLQTDLIEGQYLEDVYISLRNADSSWSVPKAITSVNTKGNDAAISISPDGKTLFTFFSTNKNAGDIYISKLMGSEFSKPQELNKNINTEYWEGSCTISADGRFLYFASERPGGLGGRDIWVSELVNGDWGPATNMGSKINTPYDDDAPFIHPDGITLFLSSKGHQSIGGYDIMFSLKKENQWLEPQSMGLPLNTTEDDRYYVINSKGDKGYFSSNRSGSKGLGKQDIYMVQPGILGEKPVIALLKGVVYGDDKPIEAKIEIIRFIKQSQLTPEELKILSNNEISSDGKLVIGTYSSNIETGKYITTLIPGAVYRIKVSAANFEPIEEDLDIENLNKYLEANKDFYLYSQKQGLVVTKDSVKKNSTTQTNTTAVTTPTITEKNLLPCNDTNLPDFSAVKGKSLNDIIYYKQLLAMAGNYCASKLIFKVQIGAYRKPENYKYKNLIAFGKPEVVNYPDGITRFTQLEFTTLNDAEVQRQKAIAKGQSDAWVVAFVDGKRYILEELIMLDFLGKAIN